MSRKELLEKVRAEQIVGVVREDSADAAEAVADAYARNGIRIIEITMTTPDAMELMATVSRKHAARDVIVAAGTVRSSNDAATARRAGAEIIVSPHFDSRVIEYAVENDLLSIAGAATPTEVIHAWEAGCDIVKIFPALSLGGPDYIRIIRGPIRDIPMLAVNLGISLAVPDLVRGKQWEEIGRRVLLATSIVQSRKSTMSRDSTYVH